MQYEFDIMELFNHNLNKEYVSYNGETILTDDLVELHPAIVSLPKNIGGYKLVLKWKASVNDQFAKKKIFSIDGNQDLYFLPDDGENISEVLKPLIAESQKMFEKMILMWLKGTPLKNIKFKEIDYEYIVDGVVEYLKNRK